MTQRSAQHGTFAIERVFDATPTEVFESYSDPAAKAKWFGPTDTPGGLSLDFRVGGREHFRASGPDGVTFGYEAYYHEIVPGHRIVYSYTFDFDDARGSVSLVTVEITPDGERARLLYTEQAVYLDGADTPAGREQGTHEELDQLGAVLAA